MADLPIWAAMDGEECVGFIAVKLIPYRRYLRHGDTPEARRESAGSSEADSFQAEGCKLRDSQDPEELAILSIMNEPAGSI